MRGNRNKDKDKYIIRIEHDRLYSFHAVIDVLNYLGIGISKREHKNFSDKGRSATKLIKKGKQGREKNDIREDN